MDIVELIEIALANTESRVEVAALEPAEVAMEAVSGLAQVVSELVHNALVFSEPGDRVRVTGLFDQRDYLISVSDRGVGIPEELIAELNRLLDDPEATSGPEPRMGIALIARIAARTGIQVRLVPGVPGTTARVTVPGRLVSVQEEAPRSPEAAPRAGQLRPRRPFAPLQPEIDQVFASPSGVEDKVDPRRFERARRPGSGLVAMSEEARREAEAFLEKVFGPLIEGPAAGRRQVPTSNGNDAEYEQRPPFGREGGGTVTALRTRIPGQNFSLIADDPSTVAAERAIDIRSALSKYQEGRRAAEDQGQ